MIDLLEAQKRLTAAVADKAHYVYSRGATGADCVYFEGDAPSCLVGHALEAELRAIDVPTNRLNAIGILAEEFQGVLTEDAQTYLSSAQQAQDSGRPWGEALAAAERTYRSLVGDW